MRRLPPLNALKTFEAVARLSSITRAGEELCVSHSSVSQQVKVLENYFGQKLFLRRGRSIEPTNAALAYLEEVRTCLDRIAISSEALTRYGKQQTISLNATPSFAMRWLIPKTASFQMMYPSIKLEISTSASDHIDDLRESYDFVFRRDWMDQRGLECHRILMTSRPLSCPRHFMRRTRSKLQRIWQISPSFICAHDRMPGHIGSACMACKKNYPQQTDQSMIISSSRYKQRLLGMV